jgi:hypothetical protein
MSSMALSSVVSSGESIDDAESKLLFEEMSRWFISVVRKDAIKYSQLLMDNSIGSIEKLRKKLSRDSGFLGKIHEFDEDDVNDICSKLLILSTGMTNEHKLFSYLTLLFMIC